MRKLFIAVISIFMVLAAADKVVIDNSKVTGYKITGDTENYLDLNFNVGSINYSDISTEKGAFTSVTIDGGYLSRIEGAPALPTFRNLIAIPYGAEPEVEVLSYETKSYKLSELGITKKIAPAQPSYSKSAKPEDIKYIYNESAYLASKFNEAPIASVSKSGTMRGIGVGSVVIEPFRYNPVENELLVYNNVQVRINFKNADPQASEIAAESYSPYFESAYSQLINYKPLDTKADLMTYPVTYLILANDNLNGNADLNRFIDWKTEKGFKVIVNYVSASSSITTNDAWIENQWSTLSPKPSFLLVIGDHDGTYGVLSEVNPPLGSTGSVTRSDLLYQVIGTTSSSNRIPSIYAGRMSVRSTAELTAQVDKTIWYEKEQFSSVLNPGQDFTYLTRPLGVAGVDSGYGASHGNPQITYGWMHYFTSANGMANADYYLYPDSDGSSVPGEIVSFMSAGSNFYNYTAHGAETVFADPSFTISNVDGLANAGEYPLVVGNCCLTGSFGTTECFGESWLNAANKGAVGFIGASMSTYWDEDLAMGVGLAATNQEPPPLDTAHPGMYDGVMALGYSSQAATRHVGLMAVEALGSGYTDDYWCSYQMFGDPSVQIYFGIPSAMTASHDGVIAPGSTTFTVTTTPYAYVAMGDQNGVLHGAARANSSGVANVTISEYTVGDTGKLVITAQFKKPYFEDVLCTGDTGGTFSYTPSSLSYGNVTAGSSSVLQFQISNSHGSEYLLGDITTITGYTVAVASKELSEKPVKDVKNTMSYSVAPGSSKTFDLTFSPTGSGTYSGNVTITSSDTGHATQYLSVTGTGIAPDINLNPASLSATTAPESSINKQFDIENTDIGTLDYSISINYTGGKEIKGSGEDLNFGYKWKDSDEAGGPTFNWVDITGTGTVVTLADDAESSAIPMDMDFPFYGVDYSSVVIGDNGAVTFTGGDISATNATIPTSAAPNALVSPFWDDLNCASTSSGDVYYYHDSANSRFIIEYYNIVDYGSTNTNTFEILLYESGKIEFQYGTLNGPLNECTVGIESPDGTDGCLVTYNSAYLKNNFAVQFQATPEWLSLDSNTGSIAGIGSDTITATCDATGLEVGTYTADIIISSNSPGESTVTLPVTFNVAYGETGGTFALNQTNLSYGNVGVGQNSVKQFTITNSHATEYLMGSITTIEGYTVAASAKEEAKNVLAYTVSPSSSKTFDLTFAPTASQAYSGNVTITSTDDAHATVYIAVSGTGTEPTFGIPFSQDFNASTSLPASWTIVDNQGNGQVWAFGTHTSGLSGADGNYAYLNSDGFGSGNTQNADLVTPKIDMSNAEDITVSFDYYFRSYTGSSGTFSYSIDGGSNWVQVVQWTATSANPATFSQAIPALDGQANVKLKWNFTGTWGYYLDIDDVLVTGTVTQLEAPGNITVVTVTASEVNLGWDAVSGAATYHVYRSTEPYSGFTEIGTSGTNSYQDTDVLTGNKYFYYITAE